MTFQSTLRQRCWELILVVIDVCVITSIISYLIPDDPAWLLASDCISDEVIESIHQRLGLN